MATDLPTLGVTEAELLHQYLGRRLAAGARREPVDRLLADFAEYRRQLEELRASLDAATQGEFLPLNLDDVIRRGRERMAAEGIVD